MIEKTEAQFIKLVKIRIGQPLTAIQIDKQKITFGSISGYVGCYDLTTRKVQYFQPINDEIIRGIYSQDNKLYLAIGDRKIIVKDLKDNKSQQISIQQYLLSFNDNDVSNEACCFLCFSHPEKRNYTYFLQRLQGLASELEQEKNNLYEIDIRKNEFKTNREFKIPEIYVPFDFDGSRILWMEYKEGGVKEFQCFDLAKKQVQVVKDFGNQYHFLSFGKILKKDVIFIQNNKNVKLLNTENNTIMDLYSHSSSIIAFDVAQREQKYFRLISVDFNGIYKEWKNGQVIQSLQLWDVRNVPELIKKHQYLFDMGYPYYIKALGNIVAITTDLGLCIFKI